MRQVNERADIPKWLVDTQNKSWEPEILISGITIAFLFIIPRYLFAFFAALTQEYAVPYVIARSIFGYSLIGINSIKLLLITHLLLRGFWAGMVGLSFVFPKGVQSSKLQPKMRQVKFSSPIEQVISVEKICSLLFSLTFCIIFYFSFICFVLTLPILLSMIRLPYVIGNNLLFIIGGAIIIIPIILNLSPKMAGIKMAIYKMPVSTIYSTFASNLGPIKTISIFTTSIFLATLISFPTLIGFRFRNMDKDPQKSSQPYALPQYDNNLYESERDSQKRAFRATIPSFITDADTIPLFVSYYKKDKIGVEKALLHLDKFIKIIKSNTPQKEKLHLGLLHQIFLDGRKLETTQWYLGPYGKREQKGLLTNISIKNLSPGPHLLEVKKIFWDPDQKKFILNNKWVEISFHKN